MKKKLTTIVNLVIFHNNTVWVWMIVRKGIEYSCLQASCKKINYILVVRCACEYIQTLFKLIMACKVLVNLYNVVMHYLRSFRKILDSNNYSSLDNPLCIFRNISNIYCLLDWMCSDNKHTVATERSFQEVTLGFDYTIFQRILFWNLQLSLEIPFTTSQCLLYCQVFDRLVWKVTWINVGILI